MSYIPDYREQALTKFDQGDQEYLLGYRHAIEDAASYFGNCDVFGDSKIAEALLQEAEADFRTWMDCAERELVCAMAEQEKYDGVEFEDETPPMYTGTRGAAQK